MIQREKTAQACVCASACASASQPHKVEVTLGLLRNRGNLFNCLSMGFRSRGELEFVSRIIFLKCSSGGRWVIGEVLRVII